MADKGTLGEIQEKLKKIANKVKMLIEVYIILLIIAFVLCAIVYLMISNSPNAFLAGKETFRTNGEFVLQTSIYQSFENFILGGIGSDGIPTGGIRKTLYDLRHNILFNLHFRTLAVMIAVLATGLMGLSMLTGDQKITIKEFAMDILIIFGTTGLLLSENVELYLDFFYGIITASANWIVDISLNALFKVTGFRYVDGSAGSGNVYAPLDIVASMFFDSEIAQRVRNKLIGMLFGTPVPFIQYAPIMALCMLYAFIATINVFIAFMIAKVTILFSLQALPFFVLFAAINDVKIRLAKKGKAKSFLWNLIDIGIMKPWVYLALMSFAAGLLFYILIIENIEDILDFSVYVTPNELAWIRSIPIAGELLSTVIHTSLPRAVGLDQEVVVLKLIALIIGLVVFKYAFDALTQVVQAISFAVGEGTQMQGIFGDVRSDKAGIYDDKNLVGGMVNPIVNSVENAALKYTMGYNAEKSNFDQKHKSLLGGFASQRNDVKKFFTGKGLENEGISGILKNDKLSREEKKEAIIKELKESDLMQDEMRDHYGTYSDRNVLQKGKDFIREGFGGDPDSDAWYGRDKDVNTMGLYDKDEKEYLNITDKHYDDYAEKLLMEAEPETSVDPKTKTPDIDPKVETPEAKIPEVEPENKPTSLSEVADSARDSLRDALKSVAQTDTNGNGGDNAWREQMQKEDAINKSYEQRNKEAMMESDKLKKEAAALEEAAKNAKKPPETPSIFEDIFKKKP